MRPFTKNFLHLHCCKLQQTYKWKRFVLFQLMNHHISSNITEVKEDALFWFVICIPTYASKV